MAVWLEQARANNTVINESLLRKKPLYTATKLHVKDFSHSKGWIYSFKQQVLPCTKPIRKVQRVDSSTVEKWGREQLLEIITNLKTFIMLIRLGCSSGFHLTRQWGFKAFQVMVEEFHKQDNSSVTCNANETDKLSPSP